MRLPENETVSLTNKVYEVLLLLVKNSGKLVTKDELMEKVWKDSFVEEANLTQTISVLRKTLGENPNQHRFIVTESGKGYRFVAKVRDFAEDQPIKEANLNEKTSAKIVKEEFSNPTLNYFKTNWLILCNYLCTFCGQFSLVSLRKFTTGRL